MEKRIQPGIYEQVINEDFAEKLAQIADNFKDIAPIDQEEGAGILTAYLRRIIDQGLAITAEQAGKKDPKRQAKQHSQGRNFQAQDDGLPFRIGQ